jgi:hypothetical protein
MDNTAMMGKTDWEAAKGPVQRVSHDLAACFSLYVLRHLTQLCSVLCAQDFAEAIAQLAMFPSGREALLHDPTVAEALQQVAAEGWTAEARSSAKSALLAMSDRQPDDWYPREEGQQHVMASYQWDVQVREPPL